MSIQPRTTEYQGASDPSWLGSAHGTEAARSATLDVSKFDQETHYPLGFIPGGTPVAKVTATSLYGLYDPEADPTPTDGTQTLVGHVLWDTPVTGTREPFALYSHGEVIEANLPFPIDAAGKTAVGTRIQYV